MASLGSRIRKIVWLVTLTFVFALAFSACASKGASQIDLCQEFSNAAQQLAPSLITDPTLPATSNSTFKVALNMESVVTWQAFIDGEMALQGNGALTFERYLSDGKHIFEVRASKVIAPTEGSPEAQLGCQAVTITSNLVHEVFIDASGPEIKSVIAVAKPNLIEMLVVVKDSGMGVCCGIIKDTNIRFTIDNLYDSGESSVTLSIPRSEVGYPDFLTIEVVDNGGNKSVSNAAIPLPDNAWIRYKPTASGVKRVEVVEIPGWNPFDPHSVGYMQVLAGWDGDYWQQVVNGQWIDKPMPEPREWQNIRISIKATLGIAVIGLIVFFLYYGMKPGRELQKTMNSAISAISNIEKARSTDSLPHKNVTIARSVLLYIVAVQLFWRKYPDVGKGFAEFMRTHGQEIEKVAGALDDKHFLEEKKS